ncbi:hypothetical protein B0H13DRAFT_2389956 [Mycena leptocephala]|nr:hypothetical protein B0H13DRAFT_2389956 [Mycena leptocephala]
MPALSSSPRSSGDVPYEDIGWVGRADESDEGYGVRPRTHEKLQPFTDIVASILEGKEDIVPPTPYSPLLTAPWAHNTPLVSSPTPASPTFATLPTSPTATSASSNRRPVRPLARPVRRVLRCRARNHHFASYTAHTSNFIFTSSAFGQRSGIRFLGLRKDQEGTADLTDIGLCAKRHRWITRPPQTSLHSRCSSIRRAPDRSEALLQDERKPRERPEKECSDLRVEIPVPSASAIVPEVIGGSG